MKSRFWQIFRITFTIIILQTAFTPKVNAQFAKSEDVKSLQTVVNSQWLSMPVMRLASNDCLKVDFDYLGHDYHRFRCHIYHCNPDGTPNNDVFENEYIDGFNDFYIEDYLTSVNTNVDYTHYKTQIPNSRCRLKQSGSYLMTIVDDNTDETVAEIRFYVVEQLMSIGMNVYTNTDLTINKEHQQLQMWLNYGDLRVTYPERQIKTIVWQNGITSNASMRQNIKPSIVNSNGMEWRNCQELIFKAGDEYRKFEILDTDRPSLNVDHITWDGEVFNAWLYTDEIHNNYITDEDANGAFLIRNSNNTETDYTCDYLLVHFTLDAPNQLPAPIINGAWTNMDNKVDYTMEWDEEHHLWHKAILLKQGYYSYTYQMPYSPNFYQTENTYQAMVFYKGQTSRIWQLVGFTSAAYPSHQTLSPYSN